MPSFSELMQRISEFFKKLNTTQKLIAGGIAVAVLVSIVMVVSFSGKSALTYLYQTPLSADDYILVTQALDDAGYDYTTKDDQYILVEDESSGAKIRMELGWQGIIPDGVKGWELFDTQSFTTTDFENEVKYQRALIGEMTTHLETLDDIESVSINVSFPDESLYSDYADEVSASVVLTLAPFSTLDEEKDKIQGIVDLIAFGIPELDSDNVVVVDDGGNVLSDLLIPNDAADDMTLAQQQLLVEERQRAKIIAKILTAMTKAVPSERLLIDASIEFDWTKQTSESELILPTIISEDNPLTVQDESSNVVNVAISEQTIEEDFQGPAYIPEGPAGVENNVPPGLEDVIDQFTHYTSDENTVNYDVSRSSVSEEKAPYEIKKISVAVAIDGIWTVLRSDMGDPIITNGGRIAREYEEVSEDDLDKYKSWIEGAIGYDKSRGDIITVETISFDHTAEFEAEDAKIRRKIQLKRTLIASIIVLFFLFIGTLVYRAVAREMERRRRLHEEELARQQQAMREAALRAAEEEAATVELSIEEKARAELLENAINVSRERPDDVARLIRTWLSEE